MLHPQTAIAPEIPYLSEFVIIQGNSVKAIISPQTPNFAIYGALVGKDDVIYLLEQIREEYPELADLLICMWEKESSYGKFLIGDNGKAFGHFQIWISKHDITYNCAMDFECSLGFTAQKIKEGKGILWTTYKGCYDAKTY